MRWFQLTLAYDGGGFSGWQVQPHARTVQAELEAALLRITGQPLRAVASGRTDAGVHALGQVVSLEGRIRLPTERLHAALNAELPDDVAVLQVREMPGRFHAIRDCLGKRYRYAIHNGPVRPLFARRYAWHVRAPLDPHAMRRAAAPLLGRHDFSSFESTGAERRDSIRTVRALEIHERTVAERQIPFADPPPAAMDGRHIELEIEADGFLYNMVRAIVGTLVEVGRGVRPEAWPAEVLQARDRTRAGPTAPPQGLFLLHARYESDT